MITLDRSKSAIFALLIATLFSLFIYLAHFDKHYYLLNTILAPLLFYFILKFSRLQFAIFGFFVGIFWFYWISSSFKHYGFEGLEPIVILGIALCYSILFFTLSLFRHVLFRALLLLLFSYLHPFGFDWFKPELILVESYFGVQKWQFMILLASLVLFILLKDRAKNYSYLALFLLLFAIDFKKDFVMPKLNIEITQTMIEQSEKWDIRNQDRIVSENFQTILKSIESGYDLVLLSESAFPLFLNLESKLVDRLKELSREIAIHTGALYYDNGEVYNSTYLFIDGEMEIAKKSVLVPFGERNPLPKFMSEFINDLFFDGASDYSKSSSPTDFKIGGYTFRNAICYEATSEKIYKNRPKYILASSNNAWFYPTIEPTLQNLLMKYYVKKYGVVIFHSVNYSESSILTPDSLEYALQ